MRRKVFISYRREDSAATALSICQYLEHALGRQNVFIDVDIRAGTKFPELLEKRLSDCKVMLVLIGTDWLTARDADGSPRLENQTDWVRLEIARALNRGIVVIPVCLDGANLPGKESLPENIRGLVDHQATSVTLAGFRNQMAGLVRDIKAIPSGNFRYRMATALTATLVVGIASGSIYFGKQDIPRLARALRIDGFPFFAPPTPPTVTPVGSEWTLFEYTKNRFSAFINLGTIKKTEDKAWGIARFFLDPALPLVPGKKFSEGDYYDDVMVTSCKEPIKIGFAERTIYNGSGKMAYHYKMSDPDRFDLSIAQEPSPGTIADAAYRLLCNTDLHMPLVTKEELQGMNFASLSTTADGLAEMYYAEPYGADSLERLVLLKENEDHNTSEIFPPGVVILGVAPTFRTIVERASIECDAKKITFLKMEYYDSQNNMVALIARPGSPINVMPASPLGLLHHIVCSRT